LSKVIVTDSSERAALAVIRSLGSKGVDVVATDSTKFNVGFFSKYISCGFVYPSPLKNKEKFVNAMLHFVKNGDFDLLIPITDFTMIPILEHRDEFENYVRVAVPPYETAMKALDKAQTIEIAERCGIPHPKTFLIDDIETLREIADDLHFPVVIKPRMKVFWTRERAFILKVTPRNYAFNLKDLTSKYMKITSQLGKVGVPQDFFLIQEFVDGEAYGVEVLMHNRAIKALFMHKRLREYPITGGASTLRISVMDDG